jgi:hypothetical protein
VRRRTEVYSILPVLEPHEFTAATGFADEETAYEFASN